MGGASHNEADDDWKNIGRERFDVMRNQEWGPVNVYVLEVDESSVGESRLLEESPPRRVKRLKPHKVKARLG